MIGFERILEENLKVYIANCVKRGKVFMFCIDTVL